MPAAIELARDAANGIKKILPLTACLRSGAAADEHFRSAPDTQAYMAAFE
jgi:hypothetical protein